MRVQCVLEDTFSLSQQTHDQYIYYETNIFILLCFFVLNNIYVNWSCFFWIYFHVYNISYEVSHTEWQLIPCRFQFLLKEGVQFWKEFNCIKNDLEILDYYYFADQSTKYNFPHCLYSKKLSFLCIKAFCGRARKNKS